MGIVYFDVSTLKCFIGSFKDSNNDTILRTIITKIRPTEIIYDPL